VGAPFAGEELAEAGGADRYAAPLTAAVDVAQSQDRWARAADGANRSVLPPGTDAG
jgi:hypothetical protein